MTRLICLIFFTLAADAALAQEPNGAPDAALMWWAHLALTVLGVAVAVRCAYQAFDRRDLQLADVPTFPKYMTSQQQYRLGSFVYMFFAASFFLLLVYLHKEVVAVAKVFDTPLSSTIIDAVNSSSAPYLLIIAVMGIVYLYLLTKEAPWNVLLMMRDVIQAWISIPSLASDLVAQIQCCLRVPADAVAKVVRDWPGVNAQDFSKAKKAIDRKWAEVCYMRSWLGARQESGSDITFFAEKTFTFDKLLEKFDETAVEIEKVKPGSTDQLAELVTTLHKNFSRLVACYLIYRNDDRARLAADAENFGITLKSPIHDNPLGYSIVYILTLVVCVYVGVYLSAIIYDSIFGGTALYDAVAHQDGANIHTWIIYSSGNYGLTIILILSLRLGARAVGVGRSQSYLVTYCWTFLIALLTGPVILTLLAKYVQPIEPYASMELPEAFFKLLVWGLGPALISVYISYYLDRQTASDLPNIDHSLSTVGWRLVNSFGFGAVTVFILLPSLLSIPETPAVDWTAEKLRFVSAGTTFLLSAGLALAAQFALRKRSNASRDTVAAGSPAGVAN
jgi:hypothetical protein